MPKPRYRSDIKNAEVLAELAKGKSIRSIGEMFDCSEIVIQRIKNGLRTEYAQKKLKGKACSCCGTRPVARTNRFLCNECFRSGELVSCDEEEFSCSATPSYVPPIASY